MNVLAFDIETVPDVDAARRLLGLDDLDDDKVARVMFQRQREATGSDFLRHHFHRVAAISLVLRSGDRFSVWSLGRHDSTERELLERFFGGIEKYSPTLVSWNGGGFDLPVIHYRSLINRVSAPRYWETGDDDSGFRWNNYLNRFHSRHTDLMDVLSGYQARAYAPLDEIAQMMGYPGKLGMDGSKVWDAFLAGNIEGIRNYCETDALNTYLVFLGLELMRGRLTEEAHAAELEVVREAIAKDDRAHLTEFSEAWTVA